jgi:transporter family protein
MTGWVGFALMALGLWGVWGFLSKVATRHLPFFAVYLIAIAGHLVVVAYLGAAGRLAVPWHPFGVAAAGASGVCMAFGLLCFFQALSRGAATLVVPFTALYPVVTVALSWVFLRESLGPRQLAGVVLAALATWLLSR